MRLPAFLFRGPAVPVILLVGALAVIFWTTSQGEQATAPPPAEDVPDELWRCNACAKIPGKSWVPCRTVFGRGNEKGARDKVIERVCREAKVPVDECEISSIKCRQLREEELPQSLREKGTSPGPSKR